MTYRFGAKDTIELLEGLKIQTGKECEVWRVKLSYQDITFDVAVELPKGATDLEIENAAKDKISSEFTIHTKERTR